jgi:hypothetical protein
VPFEMARSQPQGRAVPAIRWKLWRHSPIGAAYAARSPGAIAPGSAGGASFGTVSGQPIEGFRPSDEGWAVPAGLSLICPPGTGPQPPVWRLPPRNPDRAARATVRADVLAVRVRDQAEKATLLAGDPVRFFTEPHYNGFPAVIVRAQGYPRPAPQADRRRVHVSLLMEATIAALPATPTGRATRLLRRASAAIVAMLGYRRKQEEDGWRQPDGRGPVALSRLRCLDLDGRVQLPQPLDLAAALTLSQPTVAVLGAGVFLSVVTVEKYETCHKNLDGMIHEVPITACASIVRDQLPQGPPRFAESRARRHLGHDVRVIPVFGAGYLSVKIMIAVSLELGPHQEAPHCYATCLKVRHRECGGDCRRKFGVKLARHLKELVHRNGLALVDVLVVGACGRQKRHSHTGAILLGVGGAAAAGVAVVVLTKKDPLAVDDDGDGFSEKQGDCNDADRDVHPGGEFQLRSPRISSAASTATPPSCRFKCPRRISVARPSQ